MPETKSDLEKEIHSLKIKLGKAEARITELEAENATLKSSGGPFGTVDGERVVGPFAVPLESR
jgi:hypothetical protein